jgi:16S rRNA (uracil1498-N3)-methyltransferase
MECLYAPDIEPHSINVVLTGDEAHHARALRLREGEKIMLSNGRGHCADAVVEAIAKQEVTCRLVRILPEHGELPYRVIIALGILDNRERMEFALEKAIELGASDFVPLLTKHSERDRTKPERLAAKALAAMKQSHRARLTRLHEPMTPQALLTMLPAETHIVLADIEGQKPLPYHAESVCLCVGPEGGFSEEEQILLRNDARTVLWMLAPTRLRAETAALSGLSALTLFHQ